jgi:hypothetical protein
MARRRPEGAFRARARNTVIGAGGESSSEIRDRELGTVGDGRRSASAEPRVAVIVDAADTPMAAAQPSRWDRARISGWEIALWAFGLFLVIVAVQVNVSAMERQFSSGGSFSGEDSLSAMIYSQSMLVLSPGALTAGLVCIALAIALRAHTFLTRPAPAASATVPAAVAAPAPTPAPAVSTVPSVLSPSIPVDASRRGTLTPSAQPDPVTPVPVVAPARATSPHRAPAPASPAPAAAPAARRRAETDHSIYMRPATATPRTPASAEPASGTDS